MLRTFNHTKRLRFFNRNATQQSRLCSSRSSLNVQIDSRHNELSTKFETDKLQEGQTLHGFVINKIEPVDEMYLTAVRLTHLGTGAQYLHLERDDGNNVFSTGFRTTPMDSTGLPHILEHTTLCGSERFPCRDPFFKMLRRSLATFMNAMTGSDYTIYPFSTQNLKDFRNLQSVYLDLVFRPNLRELDFRQEGWRLEHAEANDKSSPIIFKGVVFNEMKGVFSENQNVFAERFLNSILPSHTYGVISGGDPLVIPNLSHADLVNFHKTYYHPSNARFYSYGNFPLENHLKFINDRYLFSTDGIDTSLSKVPPEQRWDKPRKEHITCKFEPMAADPSRQSSIAIGHLCNDISNVQETFELYILSQLLLKGPNAAFYKSLIESNIGSAFSPLTGYDPQTRDTMFVVGLQGVRSEDFEKVEKVFDDTVRKVIADGFKKDHVESIIHGIELQVKHQTSNFGLNLLLSLTPLWNHDGDVIQAMKINESIKRFTDKMENDPKYLQSLVEKYLINNTHRLVLTMSPDEKNEYYMRDAEKALLDKKLKNLGQDELEKIYEDGQILLAEQQKEEDVKALPTLKMEDLKDDVERFQLSDLNISNVPVQLTVQPTNGVCYYRGIINTRDLSSELKSLIPLFNIIAAKMGTQNYDYRTFDQMIQLKTGGLSLNNHIVEKKNSVLKYEEGIFLQSFCLDRNVTEMWKLWIELFNHIKLTDLQRFETLIKITASNLANDIADSGHIYAMSSAASLVSPIAKYKENQSGLHFVEKMKKIAQMKDLSPMLDQMQEISKYVLNKTHLRSAVNLPQNCKDDILKSIETFYETLKDEPSSSYNNITTGQEVESCESGVHHVLPFLVNYISKTILTVPYTDPHYAPLKVLSKLVTSVYLHPEIREKGGAYGGGAKISPDGVFSFYSYRDPNSTRTLDSFDKTYDFLTNYSFPQNDIDEAKLGVFQQVDAPVPPSDRGMIKFRYDLSDDEVQCQRQQLKNVTREQLVEVTEKYLKPGQKNAKVGRSLIGPSNPDLSNRLSENWVVLDLDEQSQAQVAE